MIYLILPSYVMDEENMQMQYKMLESLHNTKSEVKYKVVGIDNGSIDYARLDLQVNSDFFVKMPSPIGYARAVNIGWKITEELPDCEYVGVLNNDLTFRPGWLEALVANLDDETAACASYDQDIDPSAVTDHIWSSCFLMKNETRKKIGYFDAENLPYRYHDQDYWIRAKKMGLRFKRIGASRVDHKESSTYKKMPERANEEKEKQIVISRYGVAMAQNWRG
jgi:GT2 family glycosyltransferase